MWTARQDKNRQINEQAKNIFIVHCMLKELSVSPLFAPSPALSVCVCVCVCLCVCLCVSVCGRGSWFPLQQRDAPVSHQLIILWQYCPGLSNTPVPDCSVTYGEYNPSQVTF